MAVALQTALWVRRAQWMLNQCARRYGDTFTLRIAGQGTWVVLSHPRDVESVFKGDPAVLHAGEGNRILAPVLGARSVLVLDEADHLEQRRLMLPAFHGQRMARYGELIAELARAEIAAWPRGERLRLRPRMQALTLEIILHAVLGVTDPQRREGLRVALRRMLSMLTDPRWGALFVVLGPDRLPRLPAVISIVQRVLTAPFAVGGYDLSAGTVLVPSLYLVGRRPDLYPDPERFDPDRFLDQPPGTYTWIPFGGGIRRCLGAAFAQFEMETVLHELAGRALLRPVRPGSERVLRRAVTETPRHDAEVLVG